MSKRSEDKNPRREGRAQRKPGPPQPGATPGDPRLPAVNIAGSGEPAVPGRNSGRASDETRRTEN